MLALPDHSAEQTTEPLTIQRITQYTTLDCNTLDCDCDYNQVSEAQQPQPQHTESEGRRAGQPS